MLDIRRPKNAIYIAMADIEKNLIRYLKMESALNTFFACLDYCLPKCIQREMQTQGNRPVAACCKDRYHSICDLEHPAFERLRAEREKRYGRPRDHAWADPVSPCQYHNPLKGCLLTTHKSPICIAFFCRKGIDFLRSRYGIYAYDYLGVYYALEWILTGDLPEKTYHEFRGSILDSTARIIEVNRQSPIYSQSVSPGKLEVQPHFGLYRQQNGRR